MIYDILMDKVWQVEGITLECHSLSPVPGCFPDIPPNMTKEVELPGVGRKAWGL